METRIVNFQAQCPECKKYFVKSKTKSIAFLVMIPWASVFAIAYFAIFGSTLTWISFAFAFVIGLVTWFFYSMFVKSFFGISSDGFFGNKCKNCNYEWSDTKKQLN